MNIGFISCLNCYSCSGSTGCNDPFNSLGSGVSTTGTVSTNTFCVVSYSFHLQIYFDLFENLNRKDDTSIHMNEQVHQHVPVIHIHPMLINIVVKLIFVIRQENSFPIENFFSS